ncbi:polycomb group protein Psc-like, partial [Photinus pyralis]
VVHLQKLLRSKYDLTDHHRVDILHNQDCLNSHLTLIDIAYIYLWRRKGPLELTYRIYENTIKRLKSGGEAKEENESCSAEDKSQSEWKEVQLRISENGEMCITGVDDCLVVNEPVPKTISSVCDQKSETTVDVAEPKQNVLPSQTNETANTKRDGSALKLIGREDTGTTTTIQSTIAPIKSEAKVESVKTVTTTSVAGESTPPTIPERLAGNKHKLPNAPEAEPPPKLPKPTILNHTLGIQNLSNNHPLKRHAQIRRSIESVCSSTASHNSTHLTTVTVNSTPVSSIFSKHPNSTKWPPNRLQSTNLPCYAPKTTYNPIINVPKVQASTSNTRPDQKVPTSQVPPTSTPPPTILNNKLSIKTKSNNPIGYKTLRDPPKTWNPQISRASLLKSPDPKYADLKNVRPAKFFKMRNNMPRYLGNPASGVKPLYQVHNSPEKEKSAAEKTEIKKHSIVKIDPKTLKPVSEKAPDVANLSNQTDLKINTSSVPIFNPLKLQSSPKSDRKSPKSPHSPKPKGASPRDKLNLSYTPPNPFIPNLASPTLSPNQFLYPPGPPGFPPYDPRIMAAYHSFLYGQRSTFTSPPSLDLNQRKPPFELPQPKSPETAKAAKAKRAGKETGKIEKSLETAVEKLTQNRVKELTKTETENGRRTPQDQKEASPPSELRALLVTNDLKIKVDASNISDTKEASSNNNNAVSLPLIADAKK